MKAENASHRLYPPCLPWQGCSRRTTRKVNIKCLLGSRARNHESSIPSVRSEWTKSCFWLLLGLQKSLQIETGIVTDEKWKWTTALNSCMTFFQTSSHGYASQHSKQDPCAAASCSSTSATAHNNDDGGKVGGSCPPLFFYLLSLSRKRLGELTEVIFDGQEAVKWGGGVEVESKCRVNPAPTTCSLKLASWLARPGEMSKLSLTKNVICYILILGYFPAIVRLSIRKK